MSVAENQAMSVTKNRVMSVAENRAIVLEYLEAISGKDKTSKIVDRYIADSDAHLKEHIAVFDRAFPRYEMIPHDLVVEGDKVTVRFQLRGTHKGEYMGIPPTGKAVDFDGIIIYRMAGGKIAEHWIQVDSVTFMQQLGVQM